MTRDISTISGMCYIATGPKGLVRKNTKHAEVATPTVKRGFVMSKFLGQVRSYASVQWLRGMVGAIRKDARTSACVFLTTMLHPLRVRTQKVASLIHAGTKTMTAITTANRATSPITGTPDPIQLHATAHNALNMAVFYLRQPQANTVAARRKAVQALAALRDLSLVLED